MKAFLCDKCKFNNNGWCYKYECNGKQRVELCYKYKDEDEKIKELTEKIEMLKNELEKVKILNKRLNNMLSGYKMEG